MTYDSFLARVRETLSATYIRYTRAKNDHVRRVALCGGSGAEFIHDAINQGADVYLTADCKYHEFQDADGQIGLIDIDHWISERHARLIFKDILDSIGVNSLISKKDITPIHIY
jgi:putative NIF3 family GTP cyclohydrolase 1 type 2